MNDAVLNNLFWFWLFMFAFASLTAQAVPKVLKDKDIEAQEKTMAFFHLLMVVSFLFAFILFIWGFIW